MRIEFNHKMSAHCENGVISNLLEFHGIKLSEAMVFGIGSGIYFSHLTMFKLNGLPVTSFRPWPGAIFRRAAKALDLSIKRRKFRNKEKAMNALDANLEKGIPTGMAVGVFHLTYFPAPYRFHFNAHNIVCVGKENGHYIISDPTMEDFEMLSYDDLKRVRYAQGLQAPKGKMYYITNVGNIDINKAIIKGIKRTVLEMIKLPGPIIGTRGMRFLARRIKKYPLKYDARKAARHLGQIVRMQEEIGTGGAGFRFLYAAFLQEAGERLNLPELSEQSKKMTAVGDMWREFAVQAGRIVKNRNDKESFDTISQLLLNIADEEEKIYKDLDRIVKGIRK
ncbi:MAG: BtrH N-terminal domain-containing protein [Bacteroidetes bacterium]|nr:BtrH N-terminal domain-containing protein [Bacteroidota bacterium]